MHQENISKLLTGIGIPEKETLLYLTCLELGPCKASLLAKKTDLNRTTTYALLDALSKKGLISQLKKTGTLHYVASEPFRLLQFLKSKKEHLEQNINQFCHLIHNFEKLKKEQKKQPQVIVFEGPKQLEHLFQKISNSTPLVKARFPENSIENTEPLDILIYENQLIFVAKKEQFGILIESAQITKTQKELLEKASQQTNKGPESHEPSDPSSSS